MNIIKFLKRKPSTIKCQNRIKDDVPTDASQIRVMTTPIGYIRAGERALQKLAQEQKERENLCK